MAPAAPASLVQRSHPRTGGLSLRRWTVLCASAEAIGMTAAALAATAAQDPVEGAPAGDRLVVGLGWAAASAPAALSGSADGPSPARGLVLVGALALGAAMGAVLGAAQASGLRGQVRHPWRWVGASTAAWTPAMAVLFLGATTPGEDWSVAAVAGLGTVTGAAAGGVLGLVSGWLLPTLDGPPAHNQIVLAVLGSRAHRLLDGALLGLRVRGSRSGRTFELPAQYAPCPGGVLVVPGRPQTKRWWRNLIHPAPVGVLLGGRWQPGVATVLRADDAGYRSARAAYVQRFPRAPVPDGTPVVQVRLHGPGPG